MIEDLKEKALQLCYAIEDLPASEQQTKISIMASDLHGLLEKLVSLQKVEIEQQENFMKILKDIYNSTEWAEMQTKTEVHFENIDSCLLNKYKYVSEISLLSN